MKAKRKPGPIPKPQDQKKLHRVNIFFNDADYQRLAEKAGSVATMPAYIRAAAINAKPAPVPSQIPTANLEAWSASAGLQNNLNQLVRRLHVEGIRDTDIEATRGLLADLRAALLTGGTV